MRTGYRLVSRTDGRILVARLLVADRFWSRLLGLQFRRPLPPESGLLLIPCPAVHTCFVRFPVDLICLDRIGRIVEIRRKLSPWRLAKGAKGTYAILETACDAVQAALGEHLLAESVESGKPLPKSLTFLAATKER
jgi:hypothetical protein